MPKDTFFRLPKEKKEKIIEISINEFAELPFTEVSINQIIKKAGIPRGSFYQYFENKEDLYMFIIKEINKEKMKMINEVLNLNKNRTFVNECVKILQISIGMGINHEKYNKIYKNMELDRSDFIKKIKESDENSKRVLIRVIKKDQEEGKIKKDINPEILANIIYASLNDITKKDYIKSDYEKATREFKEILKIIEGGVKNV